MFRRSQTASPFDFPERTVRKITNLHEYCTFLSNAAADLSRIQSETQQLLASIGEVQRVSHALPKDQIKAIQAIECSQAVDRCAESCAALEQDLRAWSNSRRGEVLAAKLRAVRQQIRLASCSAEISTARDILSIAISMIKLYALQQSSPGVIDEKNPIVLSMQHWIQELADTSKAAYVEAEGLRQELEMQYGRVLTRKANDNDKSSTLALVSDSLGYAEKQKQAYVRLLRSCDAAMGAVG